MLIAILLIISVRERQRFTIKICKVLEVLETLSHGQSPGL